MLFRQAFVSKRRMARRISPLRQAASARDATLSIVRFDTNPSGMAEMGAWRRCKLLTVPALRHSLRLALRPFPHIRLPKSHVNTPQVGAN
jgi:hypothetical protein